MLISTQTQGKYIFQIETVPIGGGAVELTIEHEDPDNILCHRSFIVSTGSTFQVKFYNFHLNLPTLLPSITSLPTLLPSITNF